MSVAPAISASSAGPDLPVQVEGCDLGVVSLEVNEVEEVLGRLFLSLLSGKKEGVALDMGCGGAGEDG